MQNTNRALALVLLTLCLLLTACSQEKKSADTSAYKGNSNNHYQITFELHSPSLPADSTLYVTGGSQTLGNWRPNNTKLQYIGNLAWSTTVLMPVNESFEFKFTQGDWSIEIADENGTLMPNFVGVADKNKVISINAPQWITKEDNKVNGQITGEVHYHQDFSADGILQRDIIVWLPPAYNKNTHQTYPVLYMHDGQNIIDPTTASFGVDWQIDEIATELILANEIEPFIVVGINNSEDRSSELDPTLKQGQQYINFVTNTIKPFVDKQYRTKPQAQHTVVGGSSMGGIMSFAIVWEHADVFSKGIVMSPALKVKHIDYVDVVRNSEKPNVPIFYYIDNGGIGLEQELQPGIDDMFEVLSMQHSFDKYIWVLDAKGRHSEADWAKRLPVALKTVFGKNQ